MAKEGTVLYLNKESNLSGSISLRFSVWSLLLFVMEMKQDCVFQITLFRDMLSRNFFPQNFQSLILLSRKFKFSRDVLCSGKSHRDGTSKDPLRKRECVVFRKLHWVGEVLFQGSTVGDYERINVAKRWRKTT
jgi:hypothetical protein